MSPSAPRKPWTSRLPVDSNTLRLFVISVVIFLVFSALQPGTFPTVRNLQSMAVQFPEYGILAFGIMIAMLTGGIDLSIVGAANLAAIVAALILTRLAGEGGMGMSPILVVPLALLAALLVGSVCGLFNGFLVSYVGIVPILATLGTASLYTGLGYVVTGGPAITTTQLDFIGSGDVLGIPIPVIIFFAIAAVYAVLLNRTVFGFSVYMLGSNATAARFSGINNRSVLLRSYWLAGLVAGIAGIVFLARANSAKPDYGASFVLLGVLICILGGVSYTGGAGTVAGLVLAVLSIQFLSTGLNFLMLTWFPSSAAIFFSKFAWGGLLLLVMVLTFLIDQRRKREKTTKTS